MSQLDFFLRCGQMLTTAEKMVIIKIFRAVKLHHFMICLIDECEFENNISTRPCIIIWNHVSSVVTGDMKTPF